jgi:trk system potassium uptake protein TrkA
VRIAAQFVAEAVAMDATDEASLARTQPERRDLCVCAIGDESRESSIVVTALLRQMGAKRLVARATNLLHERILRLIGAHEVVNPESAFGERFATHLLHPLVGDEIDLGHDLRLTELRAPTALVGRSLGELALPKRFGITVVAIRTGERGVVETPGPERILAPEDLLVVVARGGAVGRLMESFE